MMRRILTVDLFAGLGAGAWAVLATVGVPELEALVDPRAAGAFALVALGRWYASSRPPHRSTEEPPKE